MPSSFSFIITDANGQDLFFGQNAKYNADDIKIDLLREIDECNCKLNISDDSTYFTFKGFNSRVGHLHTFLFEFISERIDTISFITTLQKRWEEKECFYHYDYDVYFNGKLLCNDCKSIGQIHKIVIK